MHPSLLPLYRGACPIQYALLNNDKKTGVSIIEASKKSFDKGNIISQFEVEIEEKFRFKELSAVLARLGGDEIVNFLKNFEVLLSAKKEQKFDNLDKKQLAPIFKERNFVYLDFLNSPAEELLILYRAFFGSQLEPYLKINLLNRERFLFFENLSHPSITQIELLKNIPNIIKSGVIYWDLKSDRNAIFIKSTTGWLVSTKVKLDRTVYLPGEEVITDIFRNKRTISNGDFAVNTLPKL